MIPYEVDPSLHPARPAPEQLDDGFSPPREPPEPAHTPDGKPQSGSAPGPKSEF